VNTISSPRRRVSLGENLIFGWFVAFELAGVLIAAAFLRSSLVGQLKGGTPTNILISIFAICWFLAIHAFNVAWWKSRQLRWQENFLELIRSPRPGDPEEASVWWWSRVSAVGWVTAGALMLALYVLGRVGALGAAL
jgi:hypothetical protein